MRALLNTRRESYTTKYEVYAPQKKKFKRSLFITVSFKEDETVAETFIIFDRDGPMNEILSGLGIALSVALQSGVSAEELANSLKGFPEDSIMGAISKALLMKTTDFAYKEENETEI